MESPFFRPLSEAIFLSFSLWPTCDQIKLRLTFSNKERVLYAKKKVGHILQHSPSPSLISPASSPSSFAMAAATKAGIGALRGNYSYK